MSTRIRRSIVWWLNYYCTLAKGKRIVGCTLQVNNEHILVPSDIAPYELPNKHPTGYQTVVITLKVYNPPLKDKYVKKTTDKATES